MSNTSPRQRLTGKITEVKTVTIGEHSHHDTVWWYVTIEGGEQFESSTRNHWFEVGGTVEFTAGGDKRTIVHSYEKPVKPPKPHPDCPYCGVLLCDDAVIAEHRVLHADEIDFLLYGKKG